MRILKSKRMRLIARAIGVLLLVLIILRLPALLNLRGWVWPDLRAWVEAHSTELNVLTLISAFFQVIFGFFQVLSWWEQRRARQIEERREERLAREPFEILRTQEELMAYLFPNPEKRVLPDADIPYLDRASWKVDSALSQTGQLLISGIPKCGKTREAAQLIARLRRTQDVMVLALKPNVWLEPPDPRQDRWLERVPRQRIVLLIEDIDTYFLPVTERKGPPVPTFQERLKKTIDFFKKRHGRGEVKVIATVRDEADRWERLRFDDDPFWRDFNHYELPPLSPKEALKLIRMLESENYIPPVDPQAAKAIASANDGTFLRLLLFLRQKLEEGAPRITPADAATFAGDLHQEFKTRYQEAINRNPYAHYIYAALHLLRQACIAPYDFLVVKLATELAGGNLLQRLHRGFLIGQALRELITSEIPRRRELLLPYEGQVEVAGADVAERIDLIIHLLFSLCRLRFPLPSTAKRCSKLLLPSLFSFGSFLTFDYQDYSMAIQIWQIVIDHSPSLAIAYNNRGFAYDRLRHHKQAIEDFNRAIELNPELAIAYSNRGFVYSRLHQYQQAIEDYNRAIEVNPNLATAYSNRGYAYSGLGMYQQAIEDLDRAIQLDPKLATAYSNRGYVYSSLNQYQRAIEDFDKAIELDPKLASAYSNRGYAYVGLGEHRRAIEDLDKAIELDPKAGHCLLQ